MRSLLLYSKKHFPKFYSALRSLLFPLVERLRTRKKASFTNPLLLSVSPLGQSFQVKIDPSNGFIDQHIYATKTYEPDILQVMTEHLRPGDIFVDIGCNIGWHSLFAATLVGPDGRVFAFEPIPRLRNQFLESLTANSLGSRVTLLPFGCSDRAEEVAIHINPHNIGGSSILTNDSHETISATLKPADDVLADAPTVHLIKIDTEGYELEVLRGLTQTLSSKRPSLIIEYTPSLWGTNQAERSTEFFAILNNAAYDVYDLEMGHERINDTLGWSQKFTKLQTNLLCLAR